MLELDCQVSALKLDTLGAMQVRLNSTVMAVRSESTDTRGKPVL